MACFNAAFCAFGYGKTDGVIKSNFNSEALRFKLEFTKIKRYDIHEKK